MEPISNLKASALSPNAHPLKLHGDRAAAQYLGVCTVTIQKLRKAGKIPYYKVSGKYFYHSSELDECFKHPVKGGEE